MNIDHIVALMIFVGLIIYICCNVAYQAGRQKERVVKAQKNSQVNINTRI